MLRLGLCVAFLLITFKVTASDVELKGVLTQGSLIRGQLPAGSQVWLDDKAIKISEGGQFAFGFGRDAALEHQLKWQ
ncbi:MAG: M23 family peptidase, partial [Paraglaciecola sp.]